MSTLSLPARGPAALLVLLFFPLLVVLLVIAVLAAAAFAASRGSFVAGATLLVLLFPLIFAVGAAAWDVIFARRPKPLLGHELTAEEHPVLWAELDTLATAMKQPRPDRVVVGSEVNASVRTAAKQREVMIGYPLLAQLPSRHAAAAQARRLVVAYYRLYLVIAMSRPPLSEAIRGLIDNRKVELDEIVDRHLTRTPSRWSTRPGDDERMRALEAAPALEASSGEDEPA